MGKILSFLLFLLLFSLLPGTAPAVGRAPRISDREIIESLAELKAGQARLQQRQDALERKMDERFDAVHREMDTRFAAMDKRFDAMQREMDKRFESVDKRFEAMDRRISDLHDTLVALFGYIVWDRRTALRPLQDRLDRLESEVVADL